MFNGIRRIKHKFLVGELPPNSRTANNLFCDVGQFRNPSYGISLDSRPDAKLIVFGLPKSGNVWLVAMLCQYLSAEAIDPVANVAAKGIGMCHLPCSNEFSYRQDFLHAVYLMRDLRDVIVSYFHHTKRKEFRASFPNFHYDTMEHFYFQWFLPRIVPFHRIEVHAIEYAGKGVPVVRYEDLSVDPIGEFRRLLLRLGFDLDDERVQRVIDSHKLEKMKTERRVFDVEISPEHFRKGGWGNFREEMPAIVRKDVEARFADVIGRWGYDLDC
jgi:Sulfotransferase domain